MKITNHHELRRRSSIDCSSPVLTDQSAKNLCDINIIMANYAKTGVLPSINTREPQYIDNTSIPTLEHAFAITRDATNAFLELPATIRKLMDNNPSNLESFISDPENAELLIKHGLVLKKAEQTKVEPVPPVDPPPVG